MLLLCRFQSLAFPPKTPVTGAAKGGNKAEDSEDRYAMLKLQRLKMNQGRHLRLKALRLAQQAPAVLRQIDAAVCLQASFRRLLQVCHAGG